MLSAGRDLHRGTLMSELERIATFLREPDSVGKFKLSISRNGTSATLHNLIVRSKTINFNVLKDTSIDRNIYRVKKTTYRLRKEESERVQSNSTIE